MMNKLTFVSNSFIKMQSKSLLRISSCGFSDIFKDKEQATEKIFINKEEKKILEKLLHKLNEPTKPQELEPKAEVKSQAQIDKEILDKILQKHKVNFSEDIKNDLFLWKKGDL